LTANYLAKVEEEKERIRAERERQRDEDAARREFDREKARLTKEQAHWLGVQEKWVESSNGFKLTEARVKLDQIAAAIRDVEAREANIRTGWVYVISNVGAFGNEMVKMASLEDSIRKRGSGS
jgi:Na+-translocating ferredoxin:NAD+ oxidoreductase RnfC subunit